MTIEKRLDLSELIKATAQTTGLDRKTVDTVVTNLVAKLTRGIAETDYATVDGLGSFRLVVRKGRTFNLLGKTFTVGQRVTVEFNAHKEFRDLIAQEKKIPVIP